jgi:hypothetical protein
VKPSPVHASLARLNEQLDELGMPALPRLPRALGRGQAAHLALRIEGAIARTKHELAVRDAAPNGIRVKEPEPPYDPELYPASTRPVTRAAERERLAAWLDGYDWGERLIRAWAAEQKQAAS